MSADSSPAALVGVDSSAGSTNNKRFRHFWEGPKAVAEHGGEEETTQGSPVARLYQHALESVFGFLSLADLSHALNVSRSWSHAVRVMPCARLSAHCTMDRLGPLCSSALSKHVDSIVDDRKSELTSDALHTLSTRMPQLTGLECTIVPSPATQLILPPNLQTLQLNLGKLSGAAAINKSIRGASKLPALVTLDLTLPWFFLGISFAPLTAMRKLEDLSIGSTSAESQPTEAQLDQLRALPQLRTMAVVALSSDSLAHLLRAPHDLRWQQIHAANYVDAVASPALSSLPSLTALKVGCCTDVGFLAHLTQLRSLNLQIRFNPWPATITAEAVVDGLSRCPLLTDLTLTAPLNSKHLGVLLPRLPLLSHLYLWWMSELDSLECLSRGPIVGQLRSLHLLACRHASLRPSELTHVYALKALEDLKLSWSLTEALSPLEQRLLALPSARMPNLKTFAYHAPF